MLISLQNTRKEDTLETVSKSFSTVTSQQEKCS